MALHRGIDGSEPVRPEPVTRPVEDREVSPAGRMAAGTLACPRCDAPVALGADPVSPAAALGCPFCGQGGRVRDFLSLAPPTRPARVAVHVALRRRR